jgi:hypothetical protein
MSMQNVCNSDKNKGDGHKKINNSTTKNIGLVSEKGDDHKKVNNSTTH